MFACCWEHGVTFGELKEIFKLKNRGQTHIKSLCTLCVMKDESIFHYEHIVVSNRKLNNNDM